MATVPPQKKIPLAQTYSSLLESKLKYLYRHAMKLLCASQIIAVFYRTAENEGEQNHLFKTSNCCYYI